MNLLPQKYIERSKSRARGSRDAIIIIATLCMMLIVVTHSRIVLDSSSERLLESQSRADAALELEVDATSLELRKASLDLFLKRYTEINTIFPMGDIVVTITNLIPKTMTLEELALDIVQTEEGREVSGRFAGFAVSDEAIAQLVKELQRLDIFENVSMDFSSTREVREKRARGFRISFRIDLTHNWEFTRVTAFVGDEE